MKTRPKLHLFIALLITAISAHAQGTAFSYQGHLLQDGVAANGPYDFVFAVFDAPVAGAQVGADLPISNVSVANGQFTATLDFGPDIFTGQNLWLEISVRAAGNAEYTKLVPRTALLPTPYAIFAETAGTLAKGSVEAGQLKTAGAPPIAGQFLSYDGQGLVWSGPGAAAGNLWSRNGADVYYAGGNVGIGTSTPAAGVKLEVDGWTLFAPGGAGGKIQFGTPNAETGLTIIGDNRADIRFDGQTLKLLANSGRTSPSVAGGLVISTNGNVGLGMFPTEGFRLDINGGTIIRPGGSGGIIKFGTPNGETGLAIVGDNRADIRFDGSSLKLVAGFGPGGIPSYNGLAVTTGGKVGIGTTAPIAKLEVDTTAQEAAVYGNAAGANSFGIFGEAKGGSSVGVWGRNPSGFAVFADGNAGQPRDKGGFPKAMVYVDAKGKIARCYNGLTGASGSACGFQLNNLGGNLFEIDFGFKVDDRFVSVTPGQGEQDNGISVAYKGSATASVVYGYQPTFIGQSAPNSIFVQINPPAEPFSIITAGFTVIVY